MQYTYILNLFRCTHCTQDVGAYRQRRHFKMQLIWQDSWAYMTAWTKEFWICSSQFFQCLKDFDLDKDNSWSHIGEQWIYNFIYYGILHKVQTKLIGLLTLARSYERASKPFGANISLNRTSDAATAQWSNYDTSVPWAVSSAGLKMPTQFHVYFLSAGDFDT